MLASQDGMAVPPAKPSPNLDFVPCDTNVIRVWDVATGRELRRITVPAGTQQAGHPVGPKALAFHPDGKELWTIGSDGVPRIWDVHTGEELRRLPSTAGSRLALAPDGKTFAVAEHNVVRILDPATGLVQQHTAGPQAGVRELAESPDGRCIATASA